MAAPWSDNFEGFACKGAYRRPKALPVVHCVLSVSSITTRINGIYYQNKWNFINKSIWCKCPTWIVTWY